MTMLMTGSILLEQSIWHSEPKPYVFLYHLKEFNLSQFIE
jgi:hypothetical protein